MVPQYQPLLLALQKVRDGVDVGVDQLKALGVGQLKALDVGQPKALDVGQLKALVVGQGDS